MFLLPLLVACHYDVGLVETKDPVYTDDTGAAEEPPTDSEQVDTGEAPEDSGETGAPIDETGDPPVDTGTPPEDTGTPPEDTGEPPADTADDPPPEDDCVDTTDLVYVLARDDSRLYTFDPSSRAFTSLGRIDCGTTQSPGSMAVGRDGVAYVRYADNRVYAVALDTLACTATSYSDRRSGFDSFGMGYATDDPDTWHEQLYVANEDTVGVLDTSTWTIRNLGTLPSQSELTGNADAELWAMLPLERVAELRRLDTSSGATLETLRLPDFPDPGDIDTFAFATWDDDFYLFVRLYGMGETTNVYKVTRDGTFTTLMEDVGFDVVGAGVSTCAPT